MMHDAGRFRDAQLFPISFYDETVASAVQGGCGNRRIRRMEEFLRQDISKQEMYLTSRLRNLPAAHLPGQERANSLTDEWLSFSTDKTAVDYLYISAKVS